MEHPLRRYLPLLAASFATALPSFAQCPDWSHQFGSHGTNGPVYSLQVFDDGTGPALFAGGLFSVAGGVPVNRLGKWDGTRWTDLGGDDAIALAVFDDGSGPALYGAWYFWGYGFVAKWNGGTSWSNVGITMPDFPNGAGVRALEVFDHGTGPALFAAGDFETVGTNAINGTVARRIARWDGVSWSVPGGGVNNFVSALEVFDDGTGPALFAGGDFTSAGGVNANRIAKWDGTSWSPLGSGVNGRVHALAVFDDGTGPALFAGGDLTMAGGVTASRIAKWDGASWSPVGNTGGSGGSAFNSTVRALTVFNDGTGPALYAGGSFTIAGGVSANRIARWDGATWSALGNGIALGTFGEGVLTLAVFNDGADMHPDLFVGGRFATAGGMPSNNIAQWLGGTTMDTDLDGLVDCADNCPGDFNPAQEDCDSDGLGDLCAIASGTSTDANFDGIPDECGGRSYCTGKTNSLGCVPFMSSVGFASVTNTNPFQVMASDCLPNQFGFLLYGFAKSSLSFHGGTLCVHGNVLQYPSKMASSTGLPPCSGILKSNMNKRIQSGVDPMLTAGARIYTQWRQRDPSDPAGFGDSFTNGLTFVIQP